jgi:TRAP-type mannitol/chloroaromatic compound transport system substrate-binding protein
MKRREVLKVGGAVAALSSFGAPFVLRAQAPINLRMQGFLAAGATPQKLFETFANNVKTASNGRVNISVLPAGGAVAATETLNAISNGILDGHYSAPSFFAARDAGFALLGDTGANYKSVDERENWLRKEGGIALARELYDRYGLYYVDAVYWPAEHIPSRKALNGVADLQGLKIRVPPGMISEVLGRAGASVVNLPGGEVFNALQSGVIDATDWASPGQNHAVGLYKAAKFSVNASHSMPTTEVSFSKRKWAELPAEVKTIIEAQVKKLDGDVRAAMKGEDDGAVTKMKGEGVTVIDWSAAEVAKLRTITAKVQADFGGRGESAKKIYDSLRGYMTKLGYNT